MSISIVVTHVHVVRRNAVFLQWEMRGLTPASGNYTFRVERSGVKHADFAVIANDVTDTVYIDTLIESNDAGLNALSTQPIAYKVVAKRTGTPIEIESDVVDVFGNTVTRFYTGIVNAIPDNNPPVPTLHPAFQRDSEARRKFLAWNVKVRRCAIGLRLSGHTLYIVKRRRFGYRCNHCLDEVLGESILGSQCPYCYSTTFHGGYHSAISVQGRIDRGDTNSQKMDAGEVRVLQSRIVLPAFPYVEKDDLVYDPDQGELHRLEHVDQRIFFKRSTQQTCTAVRLQRSAVEYNLPLGHVLFDLDFRG